MSIQYLVVLHHSLVSPTENPTKVFFILFFMRDIPTWAEIIRQKMNCEGVEMMNWEYKKNWKSLKFLKFLSNNNISWKCWIAEQTCLFLFEFLCFNSLEIFALSTEKYFREILPHVETTCQHTETWHFWVRNVSSVNCVLNPEY